MEMKIQINKQESYSVDLKEEVSIGELTQIVDRFNRLIKVFGKDMVTDGLQTSSGYIPKKYGKSWKPESKEQLIALTKIYYSKLPISERKVKLAKQGVADYANFSARLAGFRKRYGITTKDIGIAAFDRKTNTIK